MGAEVQDGDVLIAIESNGIHSNGLSLARDVLFKRNHCDVQASLPELDGSLGEELLKPTHIYVREVVDLFRQGASIRALMHLTGDGFLNLKRVAAEVGWDIEYLPANPPIFSLIQELGDIPSEEMFRVFNMGIGFCLVVPPSEADAVIATIAAHGKTAYKIGRALPDADRRIKIRPAGLVSQGKLFKKAVS
ncbi:MAG TPA: AIR synthase-related protein [Chloroflexota bacterium]